MKRLNRYEIRAWDGFSLRVEVRNFINARIDYLEQFYDQFLQDEVIDDDDFQEFISFLSELLTIFDFLYAVGLLKKFYYDYYYDKLTDLYVNILERRGFRDVEISGKTVN